MLFEATDAPQCTTLDALDDAMEKEEDKEGSMPSLSNGGCDPCQARRRLIEWMESGSSVRVRRGRRERLHRQ